MERDRGFDEELFRSRMLDLSAPSGETQLVAFFDVVLDGSGSIGNHYAVAYGGAIGHQGAWAIFDQLWQRELQKNGLTHFKMAHAMTFRGPFEQKRQEWGDQCDQKRDDLLKKLAGFAELLELKATAFAVSWEAVDYLAKVAEKKREVFKGLLLTLLKTGRISTGTTSPSSATLNRMLSIAIGRGLIASAGTESPRS